MCGLIHNSAEAPWAPGHLERHRRRRLFGAATALAATAMLVGCVPPWGAVTATSPVTASTERSAPKGLPRTKPKRPPPSTATAAVPLTDPVVPVAVGTLSDTAAAAAAATATRQPGPTSSAPLDPAKLVGLDEEQTQHLLGSPTRTGEEPPARYWQYANERCVLRVFFFMDVTTQDFRALSYDLKSSDDDPNVSKQCFAKLLAQADSSTE